MKVYKGRGLNQGETYCCSIRDVKDAFGDRDINVYFGHIQFSRNSVQNSKECLPKLKGKALILMNMTIRRADVVNRQGLEISSFLCIQIIPMKEFGNDKRKEFLEKILPKIIAIYDRYIQSEIEIHDLTVVLIDGNFQLYDKIRYYH